GLRVMDVKIEGSTVLNDLDLYAVAGHKAAIVYNFENIVVTDGILEISFLKVKDDPKISAISVQEISSDPILAVTPDTLNFGSETEPLLLTINNSGMDPLSWTATENPDYDWIQEVSPTSGTALSGMRQIVAVQVDRELLSQGTHTGLIRIGSNGGVKNVPVIVTVPGPPDLDVNVTSLDFGDQYSLLTFDVTNVGGGTVDWQVAENPDAMWITNITPLTGTLNTGETSTVAVEVSRSGMAEGDYFGRLKISNTADVSDTAGIAVSMTAVRYAPYAQRINAGGGNYTDKAGHFWLADQAYVVGGFGYDGGGTYTKNDPIAGTEDDVLYQSEHYGMSAYRFDVSPGSYQVTLHFAEIYHRYPNKRMMTIQLEDNVVLNDLDLVAEAGHDVAYVQTFSGIAVTDGRLDIQFEAVKDDPKISAIEISSISTDPILAVQPDTLDFGSTVDTLLVNITNSGKGYLVWNAAEAPDLSWITSIQPTGGTLAEGASETAKVIVNRQGLNQGEYRGAVEISSNGGTETVTVMAKV
ncbi:hypothetical protein KAH55_13835, partial [bacterium]|nr:hypothetical protein [bacterium]